jgi:ketosteroid isomerase-like protein
MRRIRGEVDIMKRVTWVRAAAVAVVGFVLAACSGPAQPAFGREDGAAIRKVIDDFVAAYNAKDSAKIVTLFTGSAALMVPNSSIVRGPEGVKGYYDMRFSQGATDLVIDISAVVGHGTMGHVIASYSFRNAPPNGPETHDRGKVIWLVQKLPGNNWRLETQIWSSDLPPQLPPAPAEEKK